VVVGDDVALGIDDEAGAEGFSDLAVVPTVALVGGLAAEKAIEEVLEVVVSLALTLTLSLILIFIVVAGVLRVGLDAAMRIRAAAFVGGGFGEGLGIDIDDGRTNALRNFYERVGFGGGICDFEGRGIAAIAGSLLAAHSVSCEGAADDGGGDGGEQNECRCETVRTQACQKRFHQFEDLFTGSAKGAGKIQSANLKYSCRKDSSDAQV